MDKPYLFYDWVLTARQEIRKRRRVRGWQTNGNYFSVPNPPQPLSLEARRLEFELKRRD